MTMPEPDRPLSPFQERLGRVAVQWMAGVNAVALRLGRGRVAAHVPGGAPICLLTTTGRRTGRPRTVPLLALPHDDGQLVVVASRGGMSEHPAWYLNLCAEPHAVVELEGHRWPVVARRSNDAERADLWPRLTEVYPRFSLYQRRTARLIPVVLLRPEVRLPEHPSPSPLPSTPPGR